MFGKGSGGFQWLLVCLGNPGKQYENTRHNIGFLAADELGRREGIKINKLRYRALTGELRVGDQRVLVLKPQTYMNLSGEAVKLAGGFYKIPPDHVLVISDDVALPLGKLRIRSGGSAGGLGYRKRYRPEGKGRCDCRYDMAARDSDGRSADSRHSRRAEDPGREYRHIYSDRRRWE